MDYTDDNILFISINKGDEKAFKFLFKSYYPRLKNYLFRFVDDEEVVNDIIQYNTRLFSFNLGEARIFTEYLFVLFAFYDGS